MSKPRFNARQGLSDSPKKFSQFQLKRVYLLMSPDLKSAQTIFMLCYAPNNPPEPRCAYRRQRAK